MTCMRRGFSASSQPLIPNPKISGFNMITAALLSLILISVWVGFYELVKQHGRLLLRLDELAGQIANPTQGVQAENAGAEAEPQGVPVGTAFPSFSFPDLNG